MARAGGEQFTAVSTGAMQICWPNKPHAPFQGQNSLCLAHCILQPFVLLPSNCQCKMLASCFLTCVCVPVYVRACAFVPSLFCHLVDRGWQLRSTPPHPIPRLNLSSLWAGHNHTHTHSDVWTWLFMFSALELFVHYTWVNCLHRIKVNDE